MTNKINVTIGDVYLARKAIHGGVRRTPLVRSDALSKRFNCNAYLKLETLQPIGAFKLRGATYAMSKLSDEQRKAGVVTCSTGNHGRAVAYAGKRLGVKTIICMSELVPENKVNAIRELGAEARIIGKSQDDAEMEAGRLETEEGMVYLSPFDHPDIVAGQGTIGIEILEDLPEVDVIFTGLSGGGLLGGIGLVAKTINPDIKIIGVTMEKGAAMVASLEAGKPVQVTEYPSFADSLGGGIGFNNNLTLPLVKQVLDEAFLVDEKHIAAEMVYMLEEEKKLLEGAAVVGPAAIEQHGLDMTGKNVVFVLSGQNVAMQTYKEAEALVRGDQA
ncbi:hydroxyectoine utilization dehydratase EutB [Enterovibrio paralichthyis]|uniref:hydroxyectoine utilization dehydratase EutB n=1 Tax=Enterovibrio paralichthyis TaxID=2853805 RepID=UPI001C47C94A|nr:hydroxyectoine utilization dehydratase EutB [Enterovibrio paralichthyis]MBV7296700.1 hydroxyectoine utilization dehydratase EutB [Enterovibrio paralichthyis]